MKITGEFLVLRYSLIEEAQRSLTAETMPDPKGEAILIALQADREFMCNGVSYAFVGFAEVKPTNAYQFHLSRYVVGKVAKLRKAHVGEKIPGDIIEHEADDWIPLLAIFDLHEQYIFVQRDWKFGTQQQVANAIQAGLRSPVMEKYNHRVFVEAKSRTAEFWSVIEKHKKIYRFEINLIAPNILRTNEKARDALKELKKLYGQDKVSMAMANESGDLKVPKEPLGEYIEYASEGEGRWTLVTEGKRGGKKKHTSDKVAISIELTIPTDKEIYTEGQLEFETGAPAPGRYISDARLIAEVISETETLDRDKEDD